MLSKDSLKKLRGLAQSLGPMVQLGKGGLSQSIVEKANEELEAHELVKFSALKTYDGDIKQSARLLAEMTDSTLVQQIGKTFVLYRRSKENKLGIDS